MEEGNSTLPSETEVGRNAKKDDTPRPSFSDVSTLSGSKYDSLDALSMEISGNLTPSGYGCVAKLEPVLMSDGE